MAKKANTPVDRTAYVTAMRAVASSVTVVTTDGSAGRLGATVSAFSSVSADPPTALVCLRSESRIARAVAENGRFNVNLLLQDQRMIADRFAGAHDHEVSDRFEGIALNGKKVPAILGASVFCCETTQTVVSGSHTIFIGHVTDLTDSAQNPLAYLNGTYHSVVPQDVRND